MVDQLAGNLARNSGADVHAHLRQLGADVGLQPALLNLIEQLVIDVGGAARLLLGGDIFSQAVE